jgi:hypothetical protein
MNVHVAIAVLPLVLVAGLIAFQRLLTPALLAVGWIAAVMLRSPMAAAQFEAMLRQRIRMNRRASLPQGGWRSNCPSLS